MYNGFHPLGVVLVDIGSKIMLTLLGYMRSLTESQCSACYGVSPKKFKVFLGK